MLEECGEKASYTVGGNAQVVQPLWRIWRVLKLGLELPYDPAVPAGHIPEGKPETGRRHVYPSVHCGSVYNSWDMKAIELSCKTVSGCWFLCCLTSETQVLLSWSWGVPSWILMPRNCPFKTSHASCPLAYDSGKEQTAHSLSAGNMCFCFIKSLKHWACCCNLYIFFVLFHDWLVPFFLLCKNMSTFLKNITASRMAA